ncbi:NADH-ubiquinone/plastoquinone oxidoreductase chain 6 [Caldalkalibacillus thermarum TA2.A1]|uniref:NADH-quinone oxidoreductase subunit J n=1 Tax=Caldalkalibacillus thermarum (strain TA2.A1) TaxID=986075 RepID=F5LA63_CALTT|nr:NADH-quinone oxidoreductase subunit J [Caldalkalibacillus thermarum]EGL81783.1 NADH-ubiquinone/plastoquinone oxidoreductase chain 6 [Caldalkalibacillus thermarum TA2.A1]QZT34158.1 NADH-quinone oxidoreductase subunit J [Caldalkalibacillus thermarum TA2.A1]GGK25709.1 NADH:ubiquinone oxidoreductase subunit J [Caldalkalibacillus thermarum]
MSGEVVAFLILSLIAISGAVFMLNLRKVVHMVMALAFTFISIAGLFVLLEAEFIAAAQVLIYAGAVTIVMLFGIMLTRHDDHDETRRPAHKWLAGLAVAVFFVVTMAVINTMDWVPAEVQLFESNVEQIGLQLFAKYVIPFELTSIVLLVALVGAIILARKDEQHAGKEGEQHE